MGKTPFNARRSDCLWLDPEAVVLVTEKDSPFWDPRVHLPVNEGLVINMLYDMQGVIEPIIVAKDGGEPVVVDGRQRVKALREANRRLREQGGEPLMCPCILKRGNGLNLFEMSISTNEQRVQDSPMEKAAKLKRLLNQGTSISDAAKIFGVSEQTIRKWEELTGLDESVSELVSSGELSATEAAKQAKEKRSRQSVDRRPRKRGPRTIKEIKAVLDSVPSDVADVLKWVLRENELYSAE